MQISLVIPHYNDPARLDLCLESLLVCVKQWGFEYEILVVDNGSKVLPDSAYFSEDFISLVICRKPGSYSARNYGVSLTTGQMLVFIDSDVLVTENWGAEIAEIASSQNRYFYSGGPVKIFPEGSSFAPAYRYENIFAFPVEAYIERFNGVPTANAVVSRALLEKMGGFDESQFSGSDLDLGVRVLKEGVVCQWNSAMEVRHPARNLKSLIRKTVRVKKGAANKSLLANNQRENSPQHASSKVRAGISRLSLKTQKSFKVSLYDGVCVLFVTLCLEGAAFLGSSKLFKNRQIR